MAQTENLLELFTQKVFRVPDYQRGYAWGEKQLSELWDDLDEIIIENSQCKPHYTGTLFLEEIKPSPEESWLTSRFYNVVDGQQRLTTIVLLVFELLKNTEYGYCERSKQELYELFIAKKKLSETGEIYKFSYLNTNQNNKFLIKKIFENDKIILDDSYQNLYTYNLLKAKEYFSNKIAKLSSEQKESLFMKIILALQFDIRTIEKDLDVQAVFETMNNRGKPLTTLEKLKNRLIYLTEKLGNDTADKLVLRNKINDAWGKIYSSLGQNPYHVLDEDEFLSAHLSLYKKPPGNVFSEKSAEEKVFQAFCNKPEKYNEDPVTYQTIENYIVSLSDLAPIWYDIHNSAGLMRKILILNGSKEVKILLAALMLANPDRKTLETPLVLLEKTFFRNSVPGMYILNIEYESATKAREIYHNESELSEFVLYLNEKLDTPINIQSVINNFRYLFSYVKGNIGFHRWSTLKYFLFAYEEQLQCEFKETNITLPLEKFYDTQVEHIMPRSWWDHWKAEMVEFAQDIDEEKKEYARKVLLNTLGNLTILGEKNQHLKNCPWLYKKERFSTGSYNEIEISKCPQWNYESIKNRGEKMIRFLFQKVQKEYTIDEDAIKEILFDTEYIINNIYK